MDLANQKCVPCQVGAPTLTKAEIDKNLKDLKFDWKHEPDPDKIIKIFEFEDFKTALKFVNQVGDIAESEGHHPNIYLHNFKKVRIELWTHKINGLHQNDFILASKIEKIQQA